MTCMKCEVWLNTGTREKENHFMFLVELRCLKDPLIICSLSGCMGFYVPCGQGKSMF